MGVREWSSAKSNATIYTATVDTLFRAWAQDVDASLIACGLVRDTISAAAQADLSTAVAPTANGTGVFKIYELNDPLSATLPIYIRVNYSGVSYHAPYPSVASYAQGIIEIGTTVDSSGNLGGLLSGSFQIVTSTPSSTGPSTKVNTLTQNYIAKHDGVLVVIIGPQDTVTLGRPIIAFALERIPDDDGNFTTAGYTVVRATTRVIVTDLGTPGEVLSKTVQEGKPGAWQGQPAAIIGGSLAASADGALQFQRFYHITPKIIPMVSLMAYFNGVIGTKETAVMKVDGGFPRRYLAIGGSATISPTSFFVDSTDTTFNTAILWG